jgi:DNA mismatch repair protein MutS2
VTQLRDDVRESRRRLERETVTAPAIDSAVASAEAALGQLPEAEPVPAAPRPAAPRTWRLGERARSSQGWEGRIAALEKGGRRATLEAGGMRVSVPVEELEPALSPAGASTGAASGASIAGGSTNAAALQLSRARTVASSLDLRGARVEEALEALTSYLDDAGLAGLDKVLIIHGHGTGALRDAVRTQAADHPLVKEVRAGDRHEGGDGATILALG